MTITYHPDLIQGSDEWRAARCGLLTASEMRLVVSPPPKVETRIKKNGEPYKQREWNPVVDDDKCRAHIYELLAQRITKYVDPQYIGDDQLRGHEDEIEARILYDKHYHPVIDAGFVTNDKWGFTIGYSPDGLVGEGGLIECKSRRQKFQVETMIECVPTHEVPADYLIQHQTGLLVSEREWVDFISYSGGLPMIVIRVYPDKEVQDAIVAAAAAFEMRLAVKLEKYKATAAEMKFFPTERRVEQEMFV